LAFKLMAKQVFILLSVLTGFFLLPKSTYACGLESTTVETVSCQEGKVCAKENESCCAGHHSKTGSDDDCGGQCNHNSCHCPSVTATTVPYYEGLKHFIFAMGDKISYFPGFVLSSGFHSAWLPPKIS
jgi:hypothetical protein